MWWGNRLKTYQPQKIDSANFRIVRHIGGNIDFAELKAEISDVHIKMGLYWIRYLRKEIGMQIPKQVKVGGKTYTVEITDNLSLGSLNYSGEILYNELIIRIVPGAQQRMESDFLHELVHAIWSHLGYLEHDEKQVDELAQALYMVIQDNPKIFEKKENIRSTKRGENKQK